jgi:hypothetical protein
VWVEKVDVGTGEQQRIIGDVVTGVKAKAEPACAGRFEDLLGVAEAPNVLYVLVFEGGVVPDKESGANQLREFRVMEGTASLRGLVEDEADLGGFSIVGILNELLEEADPERIVPHQLVEGRQKRIFLTKIGFRRRPGR